MNQHVKLVTLLLQNAVIANFEYWSEFILRIQRDEAKKPPALQDWFGERRIPSLFCLRLRSRWRIGEKQEWEQAIRDFPQKGRLSIPEEAPLQASSLMMALGIRISRVKVDDNNGLALVLADGRTLIVDGFSEEWEESWFLELPVDDPDRDQWSIVCDSQGHLSGRFPGSSRV